MRTAAAAAGAGGGALDRATLRFADVRLEVAFRRYFFGNVIVSVRAAHVLGIAAWVVWGLIIRQYAVGAPEVDLFFRFGVLIPILLVGLVVTMLPFAPRVWEAEVVCVNLLAALVWTIQVTAMEGVPFDLGYVGVIFIMAFSFTLNRLRFVKMAGAGIAMIVLYFGTIVAFGSAEGRQLLLAFFSLASFYVLGMIASYTLERSSRLLFLRERQLDHEHGRSESLLLNILPRAIAGRLKERAAVGARRPNDDRVRKQNLAQGYPASRQPTRARVRIRYRQPSGHSPARSPSWLLTFPAPSLAALIASRKRS